MMHALHIAPLVFDRQGTRVLLRAENNVCRVPHEPLRRNESRIDAAKRIAVHWLGVDCVAWQYFASVDAPNLTVLAFRTFPTARLRMGAAEAKSKGTVIAARVQALPGNTLAGAAWLIALGADRSIRQATISVPAVGI